MITKNFNIRYTKKYNILDFKNHNVIILEVLDVINWG